MRTITSVLLAVCCILSTNIYAQNIEYIGLYNTPGEALSVFVNGQYAYIADGYSGLLVIDISNPNSPVYVGSCNTEDKARGIYIHDDKAYIADDYAGLRIIDVSDPANPSYNSSFDTPCQSVDVVVRGNLAYLTDAMNGLLIFDITDPADPVLIGGYDGGCVHDVVVRDNLAYLAMRTFGIHIVDISDPANPIFIGALYMPPYHSASSISLQDNYAYLACYSEGLWVIDITDPANPAVISRRLTQGSAVDVFVRGGFAYIADSEAGLLVFDISDPYQPEPVGSYDTPDFAIGVFADDDYIYVADKSSGLYILRLTEYNEVILITRPEPENIAPLPASTFDITYTNDVGVSEVISPPPFFDADTTYPLIAILTNYGTEPQSFDIVFDIYSWGTNIILLTDTLTIINMAGNSSDTVTFENSLYAYQDSGYKHITYTNLINDENPFNDTTIAFSYSYGSYSLGVFFWYGNIEGTPIISTISERIYLDVYVLGPIDGFIANMLLVLGTNDLYIDSLLSETEGSFYYPLTEWGIAEFSEPCGSPPNPEGWSSQSFSGHARWIDPTAPLLHTEEPTKILTYVVKTANDSVLFGDTVACFGPGMDLYQGPSNNGDTACGYGHPMLEYFSPVYFAPPNYCNYTPGDINGDGQVIGSDVTYGVNYFRSVGNPPPDSCYNNLNETWNYAAGDANGDCSFIGSDITYLVAYFRGINPPPQWCPQTPPIDE